MSADSDLASKVRAALRDVEAVRPALDYVRTLPPKPAKAKRAKGQGR